MKDFAAPIAIGCGGMNTGFILGKGIRYLVEYQYQFALFVGAIALCVLVGVYYLMLKSFTPTNPDYMELGYFALIAIPIPIGILLGNSFDDF